MVTIKLSTGDYIRDAGTLDDVTRVALGALHGINTLNHENSVPQTGAAPLDARSVVEGLYALSAMVIDTLIEVLSSDVRRKMSEDAAFHISRYLDEFHQSRAFSGKHAIEALGVTLLKKPAH